MTALGTAVTGSVTGYLRRFGMRLPRISAALRSDAATKSS